MADGARRTRSATGSAMPARTVEVALRRRAGRRAAAGPRACCARPGSGPGGPAGRTTRPGGLRRRASWTRWPTQVAERLGTRPAGGDDARRPPASSPTIRRELRPSRRAARRARPAVAGAHPAAAARRPVRLAEPDRPPPRRAVRGRPGAAAPRDRRRLDAGRRAAAGRGGRTARRATTGAARPRPRRRTATEIDYAQGVLDISTGSRRDELEDLDVLGRARTARRRRPDRRRRLPERHDERRRAAPPPSAPRPTAAGRSGTSSSTRRRSCRRWPGGC